MGNLSDDLRRNRQQKNDAEVQAEIERQRQQSGKIDGTAKVRGYNPKLGGWDVETSTGGTVKGAVPHTTRGLGKGDSVDIYRRGNSAAIDAKPLTGAAANTSGDGGKSGSDGQLSGPRLIRVPGGRSGTEPRFQQDDGSGSGNGCTCKQVFTTSDTGAEGQAIFDSVEECLEDCAKKTGDEGGGPWACFEDSATGEASIQYVGTGGDFASKEQGELAIQPKFKGGQCQIRYAVSWTITRQRTVGGEGPRPGIGVDYMCIPRPGGTVEPLTTTGTTGLRGPIHGAEVDADFSSINRWAFVKLWIIHDIPKRRTLVYGASGAICTKGASGGITGVVPVNPEQLDECGDPPRRCPSSSLDTPGNVIDLG
jgi:hypothetical protein